jgi:hypothetical protein
VDRLRTVASVIADNEHYTESASPAVASPSVSSPAFDSSADFKPAAPHPLGGLSGPPGPAAGEPPSGA